MKKTLLLLCGLCVSAGAFSQTAKWNGSAGTSWNTAANWTWSNASTGVPSASTNVIIDTATANPLILATGDSVNCNNLQLWNDMFIANNAVLNIHGDTVNIGDPDNQGTVLGLNPLTGSPAQTSKIYFTGNNGKLVEGTSLLIGEIIINSKDVHMKNFSSVILLSKMQFGGTPAALGTAVSGNLIVDTNSLLMIDPAATFTLPTYTQNEIPPHIITMEAVNLTTEEPDGHVVLFDIMNEDGLNGTIQLPIGPTSKAFTPVTLTHDGSFPWFVSTYPIVASNCTSDDIDNGDAVQYAFDLFPFDIDAEELLTSTTTDAQFSLSFNKANTNEDVLPGFNSTGAPLKMYQRDNGGCYTKIINSNMNSSVADNYVKVSTLGHKSFGNFVLAPDESMSIRETPASIGLSVHPNPAQQEATIRISKAHPAVEAQIVNILGQSVWKQSFGANSLQNGYTVLVNQLPKGIYYLQLNAEQYHVAQKLVVQ